MAIISPLPREQALRVATDLGHLQGSSVYLGRSLEELAEDIAQRAALEAGGPDAEPWQAFADLFARWVG